MYIISIALIVFAGITYLSYRLIPSPEGSAAEAQPTPSFLRRQVEWRGIANWFMDSTTRQFYVIVPIMFFNFLLVRVLTRSPLLSLIWAAIMGAILYFAISQGLYAYRNRLNRQLLDLINVLAGSINAGLSLQRAFQSIAENDTLPLHKEFARAVHQWQLGASMEIVLHTLNKRINSPDLRLLGSVLLLNQELGGELSGMLERTTVALRERDRLRREVRRSTAQARLTTVIGITLPAALATLIHLLNPAYLRPLYNTSIGLMLLGIGTLLMLIGALIIYRMSNQIGG